MRTICAALLVFGLCAFALGCKKRGDSNSSGEKKDEGTPPGGTPGPGTPGKRGTFTVGKSTTYVTGPLDATGHIDYPAALNERLSKGVTPENNANVAIWKVLGPNPVGGGKVPAGHFEKMGMKAPPATGDYFVGLKQYMEDPKNGGGVYEGVAESLPKFTQRPWQADENPTLGRWLQANAKPLAALREAVKKPHYYSPLIPQRTDNGGSKGMYSALLPGMQGCREVASAFAARAMLSLGQGNAVEAWQDLLACHRLGRVIGRGGTLIEALVCMAIEQIACKADIAFLDRVKPDAKSIQACLKDLRALPPLPDVAEKIEYERYAYLDAIMQLDQQGTDFIRAMGDDANIPDMFVGFMLDGIDWNPALETANKWFDRMVGIAREKDRASRVKKYDQFTTELRDLKTQASDGERFAKLLRNSDTPATVKGQAIGDILISLLLPAAPKVQDASDRTFQTHENVITAFACAWYQRFNGKYPDKLADLVPTYLSQVPKDIFTGKDLIYAGGVNAFSFHSVGPNLFDDAGDSTPPRDDIGVDLPVRNKP